MKNILVAGLINIETTVRIEDFPIAYAPVDYNFFGIESTVSGVGYNIAKALNTLGATPHLLSIIGDDLYKELIIKELEQENICSDYIKTLIEETPQSVILYNKEGKRKINLDLKDIQDSDYPKDDIQNILEPIDLVVICNINFSRGLLTFAKDAGKIIATDVHVINSVEDDYNRDYMAYSNILFFSNENILNREHSFIKEVIDRYNNDIVVVGMGDKGALLYVREDNQITHIPAVNTRNIVSTVGAGDALFSAFIYFYSNSKDPYESLKNAVLFASYKIGEKGAASGFLTEEKLLDLKNRRGNLSNA